MSAFSGRTPFFLILIGLLLLINGVLFFNNSRTKQQAEKTNVELEQIKQEQTDLLEVYKSVQEQLESTRDSLIVKDSLAIRMEEEIQSQEDRIGSLLRKQNITKADLESARIMIQNLRDSANNYQRQIEQLKLANIELSNENEQLHNEVTTKQQENQQLSDQNNMLVDETNRLGEERDQLQATVNRAAVLQSGMIAATGVRYKKGTKEVETTKAKRAEKIRLCFDLMDNPVAKVGNQEIMMRITDPTGTVLSVKDMGSGVFTNADNGQISKYTSKALVNYTGEKGNYCMYWQQDNGFMQGNYEAEIYNQGYKIGERGFSLN